MTGTRSLAKTSQLQVIDPETDRRDLDFMKIFAVEPKTRVCLFQGVLHLKPLFTHNH